MKIKSIIKNHQKNDKSFITKRNKYIDELVNIYKYYEFRDHCNNQIDYENKIRTYNK